MQGHWVVRRWSPGPLLAVDCLWCKSGCALVAILTQSALIILFWTKSPFRSKHWNLCESSTLPFPHIQTGIPVEFPPYQWPHHFSSTTVSIFSFLWFLLILCHTWSFLILFASPLDKLTDLSTIHLYGLYPPFPALWFRHEFPKWLAANHPF